MNKHAINTSDKKHVLSLQLLSKVGVPRLQEKPLVIVAHSAFEDLGVSWVDVVIRGL